MTLPCYRVTFIELLVVSIVIVLIFVSRNTRATQSAVPIGREAGQIVASVTSTSTPTATTIPVIGGVLDTFNRLGPALGANWAGSGSTIIGNQLIGGGSSDDAIYWQQIFGADQWASIKIVQLTGCGRLDLLLKAHNNAHVSGLVDIHYDGCTSPKILIYTYNPTISNFSPFNGSNETLNAGDVISVQVNANQVTTVFKNGTPIVSDTLTTLSAGFDVGRMGQIGLIASSAVILDDFDGGSLNGTIITDTTATPTPTRLPFLTPESTPTPTLMPTRTATVLQTKTSTQTAIPTLTQAATPSPTKQATSTQTAMPTLTQAATPSPTKQATSTQTAMPTLTQAATPSPTKQPTSTQTPLAQPAINPTLTYTPNSTATPPEKVAPLSGDYVYLPLVTH